MPPPPRCWSRARASTRAILEDVAAATSSVHINQFGFRPGVVGDEFAEVLLAKAAEGVPVRLVVDTPGLRPGGKHERRSTSGSRRAASRSVSCGRRSRVQPPGRSGAAGATRWNVRELGHIDHRKVVIVDGRTGWVGGAGIEDHFQDGRFHDLFVRVTGPVVAQLQLVFLASFRWLGGLVPDEELDALFPALEARATCLRASCTTLRVASGRSPRRSRARFETARETLDVVNPYVTDRGMIRRVEDAARRGVRVRLFVPANANNWACAAAQQFHHATLLDAGVRILEYPTMLHAKAFVRDGEELLVGTCNLEAWSLKRFFEIDLQLRSPAVAAQFEAERLVRIGG